MTKALISIDYTEDFVADSGKLTAGAPAQAISAFSGTDLDIRLRERRVSTVILTGVLTDICVLHTAIDAYNLGYDIEIVKPAVASIWPENHQFALGHFKNTLGAKLVDENLNELSE
ncbi:isochorismatase family cysteine hydrolase [Streptococcus pneumoniae]|nr:isochorismatase family cysteine hydrolase [Streptococcus pneumoniae]